MNREELQKRLQAEFIGKELDLGTSWNYTARDLADFTKKELTIMGREDLCKFISGSCSARNYIHVEYRGKSLFCVHFKTKREYKHVRYSDRWYVNVIQSLEVAEWFNNFEERIAKIDQDILDCEDKKKIELQKNVEFYKAIKSAYPNMSDSDFRYKLKELTDYAVFDKIVEAIKNEQK